jgi:hypothetical protein
MVRMMVTSISIAFDHLRPHRTHVALELVYLFLIIGRNGKNALRQEWT